MVSEFFKSLTEELIQKYDSSSMSGGIDMSNFSDGKFLDPNKSMDKRNVIDKKRINQKSQNSIRTTNESAMNMQNKAHRTFVD